jgi:phosphoglycerol transferase
MTTLRAIDAKNPPVDFKLIVTNPKKFWTTFSWVVPTFTVMFFIVAGRVWEVLPKIMGDELIYSRNARLTELADISVPNYLFALVFGNTNMCGYDFYYCAKGINFVFLAIFVAFVYLGARLVARPAASFWIAVLAMLGPISTYTSYFTPEMMFFAGAAALLYALFRLSSKSPWWAWLLIGVGLGLLALVKPHALFLVPPFVVYAAFLAIKGDGKRWLKVALNSALIIGATLGAKLALGFAFAGERGLGLFGGSYDASAGSIIGGENAVDPELGTNEIARQGIGLSITWQIVFQVAFLLIFFGLPLILAAVETIKGMRSKGEPNQLQKISFLLIASLGALVLVAAVFVATSASFGEMIQNRVMIRYYEYLLPFLPLVLIALRDKIEHLGKGARWGIAAAFVVWMAIALPTMSVIPPLFTDSALMSSTIKSGIPLVVFAVISFISALIWVKNHETGEKVWVYAVAPVLALTFAISTYFNFTSISSIVGTYTHSSRWAHDNLTDEQKSTLMIIGNNYPNVQQAQFWLDDVNVEGRALPENGLINLNELASEGHKYLLAIGTLQLAGDGEILYQEEKFAFIKVGK